MTSRGSAMSEAQPGSILLVIHNFVARSPDELSLAKGDRIELIERDDDFGDGWFLGRHMANGNTGLFPEVYTTPAPRGTLQSSAASRRASDGPQKLAQSGAHTGPSSPTQQRHLSASSVAVARPSTATSAAQLATHAALQRNLLATGGLGKGNAMSDSPVMNETLSVIDEHMNDMHTPRPAFANGSQRDDAASSVGSVYSSQPLNRFSYIAGHETDEEDQHLYTGVEVNAWSAERVAEYLEDQGVEKMHCDVFKEQEITGEVLLAMDQSSLFIKEFELGPVGRRLKTWHKIKALQDEVKQAAATAVTPATNRMSVHSDRLDDLNDAARNRASTMGSALPQALSTGPRGAEGLTKGSGSDLLPPPQASSPNPQRMGGMSPLQSITSMTRPENYQRPSAQSIRAMQHSRRHSSMDSNANSIESTSRASQRKQTSVEGRWHPGQGPRRGSRSSHSHAFSTDSVLHNREARSEREPRSMLLSASPSELEAAELPGASELAVPMGSTQRRSVSASRAVSSSRNGDEERSIRTGPVNSADDSLSRASSRAVTASSDGVWTTSDKKVSSIRSVTSPGIQTSPATTTTSEGANPVVTKLEYDGVSGPSDSKASSPTTHSKFLFFSQRSKTAGLRTISDAVTQDEKRQASPEKDSKLDSPAGAGRATPSTDTGSLDLQKSEAQSRTSQGSASNLISVASFPRRPRARTKTKKSTSAYTRGLEKKTPAEQMQGCDYSGWMKKKSGSLMTTWKPRLFILRGRRLSYYYAEDDTEEKGLIDISFHRVLPAQNEMLTGLHASLTGAMGSPTSPKDSATETAAQLDLKQPAKPGDEDDDSLFIFKLVPPKAGLSKGVNFTKPTVHYFAVNSRREGRLWMAALMKATIDRDEDGVVTTTYNQKTISLAKARARKERPPALKDSEEDDEDAEDGGEGGEGVGEGENSSPAETTGSELAPATSKEEFVTPMDEKQGLGIGLDDPATTTMLEETDLNLETDADLASTALPSKEMVEGNAIAPTAAGDDQSSLAPSASLASALDDTSEMTAEKEKLLSPAHEQDFVDAAEG